MNQKILVCFGTRPEYIKVKSIIENIPNIKTCFTGQHKDLLKNINVDYELSMDENISENRLNNIMANIFKYSYIFDDVEYVMVQGDTTTACAMALSAFNHGKKIIHLEAGLRTGDITYPFPEEVNRQLISRIANIHLCPTELNKKNLEKENVSGKIYVVGNTGLDNISKDGCEYKNQVLVTMHRKDNHEKMDKWFQEIEKMANKYTDIEFIIPLHPNPNVQKHKYIFNKVKVIEPLEHEDMIEYLKKCKFVISDSGGLQEECSYLNKKIIVCRKITERPESIGIHSFMCEEPEKLEELVDNIMINYEVDAECPYGNGKSWEIINVILKNNYWDIFYKLNSNFNYEPSTFYNFVMEYLKDYPENKTILDLGCGNGRDLINFSKNGLTCSGIDYSYETCKILRENNSDLDIIHGSFIDYDYKDFDIYYSRFTLHAVSYDNVLKFIDNISEKMNEKSLLFIETRSIMGTEYENYDYYEANFKSGIGDYHNRTLFKKDYLIKLFNEKDIFVEYELEDKGLSPYKGEDPYLIRLVLRKVNVETYMESLITEELLTEQIKLKKYFDEIITIFEENNINYVVFFGNLIGLLRHNNIFIPWDDDIDILVSGEDIPKLKNIFENKGYNFDLCTIEYIKLKKNGVSIDLFYNHYSNSVINLENYYYINNYRVPKDYSKAFENFYKNFSYEKIMEECVIYNHKINDRWTKKNMIKVKKSINKVNELINIIKEKKENKIINIINKLDKINSDNKIQDICLYIITNNESKIKLFDFIESMTNFNLFDSYINIPDSLYELLSKYYNVNYIDILKKYKIFLFSISNKINLLSKDLINNYIDISKKNLNDHDKVIIYQEFPIFIKKYNLKNKYIEHIFDINIDIDEWFNKEIKKDMVLFELFNLKKIYGFSSNGICIKNNDFKKILEDLPKILFYLKGEYPTLEVILPTYIKNNNIEEVFFLNKSLWNKNVIINEDDIYTSYTINY